MTGILAALLVATAIPDQDPVHVAIAAGAGTAFGQAGAHLEFIILQHVAIFGGVGAGYKVRETPLCIAGGLRFFSGHRAGLMLSLQGAFAETDSSDEEGYAIDRHVYLGATLGWRQRFDFGLFLEGGAGIAWEREHSYGDSDFVRGFLYNDWHRRVFPDLDLAIGFDF